MDDKIIAAAREADQGHAGSECELFGGGVVSVSTLARLYALAYRQGLEDAALRATIHSQYPIENEFDRGYDKGSRDAATRIRALMKEKDHG